MSRAVFFLCREKEKAELQEGATGALRRNKQHHEKVHENVHMSLLVALLVPSFGTTKFSIVPRAETGHITRRIFTSAARRNRPCHKKVHLGLLVARLVPSFGMT